MPTYNDSRLTYEQALYQYNGTLVYPALSGNQAAATADLVDVDNYRRTLVGNQPAITDIIYEQPGFIYEEPVASYDFLDSNFVTYRLHARRALSGEQPAPFGSATWRWAPYIWALYSASVTGRVAGTQYNARVATQDEEVRYRSLVEDERTDPNPETVYREHPPRPYTKQKTSNE